MDESLRLRKMEVRLEVQEDSTCLSADNLLLAIQLMYAALQVYIRRMVVHIMAGVRRIQPVVWVE